MRAYGPSNDDEDVDNPDPPLAPFSNITVSEADGNKTLTGEALRYQSSNCLQHLLVAQPILCSFLDTEERRVGKGQSLR